MLATAAVHADPVDPARLPPIAATHAKAPGDPAAIYAASVDADVVMFALRTTDFAVVAGAAPIDGKLGDGEVVTSEAAFDAIAPSATVRLSRTRGSHAIDLEFTAVGPLEVLRLLADTSGASYVFAPQHALPALTIHAKQVDVHATAVAIAKLAGLELVEHGHVWIVVEPAARLDAKLVAKTEARTRVEIDHAHPGEARRLLHPDVAQDHNACPKDTWIDASLHGETGALEAVLGTLSGPACEQQPSLDELDSSNAELLGILVGPKVRRAVFRVPHGARAFEPTGRGQHVEIDYVTIRGDETTSFHPPIAAAAYVAPGPFEADRDSWHLRGTVRFSEGVGHVLDQGDVTLIEIGPGQILSTLCRQHPGRGKGHEVLATIRHPQEQADDAEFLLGAIGRFWMAGGNPDWSAVAPGRHTRLSLPTYPFQRTRFWVDALPFAGETVQPATAAACPLNAWRPTRAFWNSALIRCS